MRRHLYLISMIVAMTCAIATIALLSVEQNLFYFHGRSQGAKDFLQNFSRNHQPLTELNLSSMYGGRGQYQMLHPIFAVQSMSLNIPISTCPMGDTEDLSIDHDVLRCEPSLAESALRLKQQEFLRLLKGEPAPADFFASPPYTAESGSSFAYLLALSQTSPFGNARWVSDHLSYFRTTELKEIMRRFKIVDPQYTIVAQLTKSEINSMVEGENTVLTSDYLLVKDESRLGFSPLSYWVFDVRDVNSTLRDMEYELAPYGPDLFCLERTGNACWTYNSKTALAYVYRYSVALIVFAAIVMLVLIALYSRFALSKSRQQRMHQTSLQVLSHELRTPVSSMLLLLERLSNPLARFDEVDQDTVTQISAEAHRLQRIIEMSRTYLQATSSTTRFNFVTIASINTWVEEFAIDCDSRIRCDLLPIDQSIEADPFWLRFALSNLVQNAFAHGKEPVHIRLRCKDGRTHISVEDQGICEFTSLTAMTAAFVKSSKSSGMGLGLNITFAIVKEWGGELDYQLAPTAFSIAVNNPPKGSLHGPDLNR